MRSQIELSPHGYKLYWYSMLATIRDSPTLLQLVKSKQHMRFFMVNVTVDEIQKDPVRYLRQVEAGETFAIFQADKLIAELRPASQRKKLRPIGLCAGEFSFPDDFDDPLPDEIVSTFEGQ